MKIRYYQVTMTKSSLFCQLSTRGERRSGLRPLRYPGTRLDPATFAVKDFSELGRYAGRRYTILPATIVAVAAPLSAQPSNGELRLLERLWSTW
jgi:hypothetical protein